MFDEQMLKLNSDNEESFIFIKATELKKSLML